MAESVPHAGYCKGFERGKQYVIRWQEAPSGTVKLKNPVNY
ncbi:hypothetical protein HMPREF3038_00133 [Akkermansia sp. KLE1797]|nr:hypothetical protein HMPREF3038_00133 [Akkermansia sp. KLE1797]KXU55786.1 hypothetical protein HMPREF3039_00018 [Akkermansia sp. KLE1798]KZA05908.1 hypothetical protein HMPREF1326_00398 [Akkermansia sp. KLE1605]